MNVSTLELWRLSDELSVIDAALLVAGHDPGEVRVAGHDPALSPIESISSDENYGPREYEDQGFRAVFKALRLAIMSNKVSAVVAYRARPKGTVLDPDEPYGESPADNEISVKYQILLRASGTAQRHLFGGAQNIQASEELHILCEPDWNATILLVEDFRSWLSERGITPEFFFPQGATEGFRDRRHPRYAPKLACAVSAWEAVERPQPNKSVKMSLEAWIMSNGVNFGLGGDDGIVSQSAAGEVAKIVNWNPKGGATPTALEVPYEPKRIENYSRPADSQGSGFSHDLDDEIPF